MNVQIPWNATRFIYIQIASSSNLCLFQMNKSYCAVREKEHELKSLEILPIKIHIKGLSEYGSRLQFHFRRIVYMEVCVSVYGILPPSCLPFQWRNSDWKLTMSHHQCVCVLCWHNKIHFLCEYHPLSLLWCVPSISVNYLLISSKVFTDAILLPHKVV